MTDINIGAITESLNYKSDLDLGNTSPQLVDYIVEQQLPTAENNYTWYRKYKSGWVEQGGLIIDDSGSGSIEYNVTFPIEMANNTYITNCFTDKIAYDSTAPSYPLFASQLTTTGMKLKSSYRKADYRYHWEVKGMSAGI